MPLNNLLGRAQNATETRVEHPVKPSNVLMAGLITEDLRDMDSAVTELGLPIVSPEYLTAGNKTGLNTIVDWLWREHIGHLAVHWDLDSLDPADFRSILPADPADFPAAVGRMTLNDVSAMLAELSRQTDLVGLTIAEHMPWDALNMRNALANLSIFSR